MFSERVSDSLLAGAVGAAVTLCGRPKAKAAPPNATAPIAIHSFRPIAPPTIGDSVLNTPAGRDRIYSNLLQPRTLSAQTTLRVVRCERWTAVGSWFQVIFSVSRDWAKRRQRFQRSWLVGDFTRL